MRVSPEGIAALVIHEGIVPAPYLDSVGVLTYGVGHTAAAGSPTPASMERGMPVDLDAALRDVFEVFEKDLEKYSAAVRRAVKVPMAKHEFDAAVSFHFNTGAIGRASWVKHWNAGNKPEAVKGIMSWKKPPEIIKRRKQERDLFAYGTYPSGKATVWEVSKSGKVIWKAARRLSMSDILNLMDKPTRPQFVDHAPGARDDKKTLGGGLAALISAILNIFTRKGKK